MYITHGLQVKLGGQEARVLNYKTLVDWLSLDSV